MPSPRLQKAITVVERTLPGGGWAWLAGTFLLTEGAYNAVWGAAAIAHASYFTPDELLLGHLDEQVWGALTLVLAATLIATAALVFARRRSGVALGLALTTVNALAQLWAIPAFPVWSSAALVLDLVLLYALWRTWRTAT